MEANAAQTWRAYCAQELALLTPILTKLGIVLEDSQPHIAGERYLMHAVTTTSGKKLILLGRMEESGMRVVIKATRDTAGKRELTHERDCRAFLAKIRFAYDTFFSPEEILFLEREGFLVSVQAYIAQSTTFLERPVREQFMLALNAFKAQESAHATTYEHARSIRKIFGSMNAAEYEGAFKQFRECVRSAAETKHLEPLLERASKSLTGNTRVIEQYTGFLTHTDFVPHNFRVVGSNIYLLDHSSLRFGNKYEGWARFLNFMALYNRELEVALSTYVQVNRAPEEYQALQQMRIYRLGEILCYYVRTLPQSEGDLRALNIERIKFWSSLLEAILNGTSLPESCIEAYKKVRDSLRSTEEKVRQQGLH